MVEVVWIVGSATTADGNGFRTDGRGRWAARRAGVKKEIDRKGLRAVGSMVMASCRRPRSVAADS